MRRRRTTSHENGFGRQDLEAGSGALGLPRHAGAPAKSRIGYLIFMTALTDEPDEQDEQLNLAQAIRDMLG